MKPAFLLILLMIGSHPPGQHHTLTVSVEGMDNAKGDIRIGLYREGADFPDPDNSDDGAVVANNGRAARYRFTGLVPGRYAVGVVHDENRDGKLTRNMLGMPKEGYGFSNNVFRGSARPPSFDQAAIRLRRDTTIRISLKYFLSAP